MTDNGSVDPQGRRSREGRRCAPSIHQAAHDQGPQVPAAASQPTEVKQEGLCAEEAGYILLDYLLGSLSGSCVHGMVERVLLRFNGAVRGKKAACR